jgi:hypothetical protein
MQYQYYEPIYMQAMAPSGQMMPLNESIAILDFGVRTVNNPVVGAIARDVMNTSTATKALVRSKYAGIAAASSYMPEGGMRDKRRYPDQPMPSAYTPAIRGQSMAIAQRRDNKPAMPPTLRGFSFGRMMKK